MSTVTINNGLTLNIFGGAATISRGSKPSPIEIYTNPITAGTRMKSGDISFDSVTFTNCKPVKAWLKEGYLPADHARHVFVFHDRRCHWANVMGSGTYNLRHNDGTIVTATKRNLKQIADEILSDVLGESSVTTTGLPTDIYPYVRYHGNPADALCDALRRCGCDMALKNDNSIECFKLGSGTAPTTTGMITQPNLVGMELPQNVKVVYGPTWWQSMFELEAVGQETDGSIKPINDLSYKPSGGWNKDWPHFFAGVLYDRRVLAFRSVFKWYRIKQLAQGGYQPVDCTESVTAIDQLLPIFDSLVRTADNHTSWKSPLPSEVHGSSWQYTHDPEDTADCVMHHSRYTFDGQRGIIMFDHPVFKLNSSGCPEAADLHLICRHRVRTGDGDYVRRERTQPVTGGTATDPFTVYMPELFEAIRQDYASFDCGSTTPTTVSNQTAIDAEADSIAAIWEQGLSTPAAFAQREYNGIVNHSCSGVVPQVEFRTGQNRNGGARRSATIVGIGQAHDWHEMSENQRHLSAKVDTNLSREIDTGLTEYGT